MGVIDYVPQTTPFDHQAKELNEHATLKSFALFWEQGVGKTKPSIDKACYLYEQGLISGVLVVASNGVHRAWVEDELPVHVPERLHAAMRGNVHFYESPKAGTKWHEARVKHVLKAKGPGIFPWLLFSYEGFMTKKGKQAAWNFLRDHKCFYILDEADKIKTPDSKRGKSIIASGRYAPYKQALTGTPITQSPFDVYTIFRFLDQGFWKKLDIGVSNFQDFKTFFGIYKKGYNKTTEKEYNVLVGYRNLELLTKIIQENSSRLLKNDVLDLPPKLYTRRTFDLTATQRRMYNELKDEYYSAWQDEIGNEKFTSAGLAIVRLLRLQQITCGYLPSDDDHDELGAKLTPIPGPNPRLDLVEEVLDGNSHSTIVWARFTKDIDLLIERIGADKCVRYDGRVSDDQRAWAKSEFQKQTKQYFVGNPAAGSDGLTLNKARTVMYYNNSFKLRERLQSEDRAHRIGTANAVLYIDLTATGTVDLGIVRSLRAKRNIASEVLGDELKEWM